MTTAQAYAGTVATSGAATNHWTSPTSAQGAPDNSYTSQVTGASSNDSIIATNFGFSIPSGSTVTGITATVWTYNNASLGPSGGICAVTLNASTTTGTNVFSDNTYTNSTGPGTGPLEGQQVFGSTSAAWGLSLTDANINTTNFGVIIQASRTIVNFIDAIQLTITYTTIASPTPTPTVTPTLTPSATISFSPSSGTIDPSIAGFIAGTTSAINVTLAGNTSFEGLPAGSNGQRIYVVIVSGNFTLTFLHLNGSTAQAQILASGDFTFSLGDAAHLFYEGALSQWILIP